jgi:hypothetical protein
MMINDCGTFGDVIVGMGLIINEMCNFYGMIIGTEESKKSE